VTRDHQTINHRPASSQQPRPATETTNKVTYSNRRSYGDQRYRDVRPVITTGATTMNTIFTGQQDAKSA
jgi:hypothetical protein